MIIYTIGTAELKSILVAQSMGDMYLPYSLDPCSPVQDGSLRKLGWSGLQLFRTWR